MPQVPLYNREEKLNGAARPYEHYNLNGYTFGQGQAQALGNMGNAFQRIAIAANHISDTIERTKGIEFNNAIEKWKQEKLLDKENGYFVKQGADAAGQSAAIMQDYDDFVANYKKEHKATRFTNKIYDDISTRKRTSILDNVTAHDLKQTNIYAETEGKLGIDNAITNIVAERNNPENIQTQLDNIKQITQWKGAIQNKDSHSIKAETRENISKALCSILDVKIQENPQDAKAFFEEHKNEIKSDLHARYINIIDREDRKYQARDLANQIIINSASEQDAIIAAEKIDDVDMSDAVLSRVKKHYAQEEHFKNLEEKEALNNFYNLAIQSEQTGQGLSYDDIPDNLDPQVKLSLMNYINKNGQPDTDDETWETLYKMSVNDAQGFAKEDLNKYRGFLSDSEYKSFLKRQEEIRTGKFYTQIKDDDKKIDAALKTMGLNGTNTFFGITGNNKDIAYSEIRAMVREFEARKGRAITDTELENITNSLGYKGEKGVQLYKQLEKGMREKVGFIRDVMNDYTYYQSKHNGEMPSDEEKLKIINNRLNMKLQEQNTELVNSLEYRIHNTQAKPNETKELTYYADKYLPQLSNELGVKFTIVEGGRYRPANGSYKSHHTTGEAADVSMSEHNVNTRLRFIESQLKNPQVKKIGTSDPNILAKYGTNPKIEDERKFDKQHGTNHVNHAHITLNIGISNQMVRMKAPNGRIVLVPQSMVEQATKQGGVRL